MSEPNGTLWTAWITAGVAVIGVVYTIAKRFFSFVTRTEFQQAIESRHEENKEALKRIEEKVDAGQWGVVASRLGRVEKDVQDLRDWKHKVDPYIARRVDP